MNAKAMLLIKIIAIFSIYLVFSLPFVSAININIYVNGNKQAIAQLKTFKEWIGKSYTFPFRQNTRYINIKLSQSVGVIKKVYLYKCFNFNPYDCIQNLPDPVIYANPASEEVWIDETYVWNDISMDNTANFIIFAKVSYNNIDFWTASFDIVKRTGPSTFEVRSYEPKLKLNAKPGIDVSKLVNYIETNYAIPLNWLESAEFSSVDNNGVVRVYEIKANFNEIDKSGLENPDFYINKIEDNEYSGLDKDISFLFAESNKIAIPVMFYRYVELAGGAVCGNNIREAGEECDGTDDSACPGLCTPSCKCGQPGVTPRLVIDSFTPQMISCSDTGYITVNAHVENPSDIGMYQGSPAYFYKINGIEVDPPAISCYLSSQTDIYSYICKIKIDSIPNCEQLGSTPNIVLHFNYANNVMLESSPFTVTVAESQPSLVIESVEPDPFDCRIDSQLEVRLMVNNEPAGSPTIYYSFNNQDYKQIQCSRYANKYTCRFDKDMVCGENTNPLVLKFKFVYSQLELESSEASIAVIFPPPSLDITSITPEKLVAGNSYDVTVLASLVMPSSIEYSDSNFRYKYLDKAYSSISCTLDKEYPTVRYYRCTATLDIPAGIYGTRYLTVALDGYVNGKPETLEANYPFEIVLPAPEPSISITELDPKRFDCSPDSSGDLYVFVKVENAGLDKVTKKQYALDEGRYSDMTCMQQGNGFRCVIPRDDICGRMKESLTLKIRFEIDKSWYETFQSISIMLPEPHMQVQRVYPNYVFKGEKSKIDVILYITNPGMLSSTPSFSYSYLEQTDLKMSCTKTASEERSGLVYRDWYKCRGLEFNVPRNYANDWVNVLFSVENTQLSFPYTLAVKEASYVKPWIEIYTPAPIAEVTVGNATTASLEFFIHNADANGIGHSPSVITNEWIKRGTCKEDESIPYKFNCELEIKTPSGYTTSNVVEEKLSFGVRVTSASGMITLTNETSVIVRPVTPSAEITSISPDKIYCKGHPQANPNQKISFSISVYNLEDFRLTGGKIYFNNQEVGNVADYCKVSGTTINCEGITEGMLSNQVDCSAFTPGEVRKFDLVANLTLSKEKIYRLSASGKVSVEAPPLKPYLEVVGRARTILCLKENTFDIDIIIRNANLVHKSRDDELSWQFKLEVSSKNKICLLYTSPSPRD